MCFWQACESPTCFSSSFRRCPLISYWWQNKVYHTLFHISTVLTLWPATPADPCSPVFPGSPYEWKRTCFELETEQKIHSLTWHCTLMHIKVQRLFSLTLKPLGPDTPMIPAGPLFPIDPAGPGRPSSPGAPWTRENHTLTQWFSYNSPSHSNELMANCECYCAL